MLICWALLAAAPSFAAAPPQKSDEDRPPEVDPYSEGEREAFARAGYVSFGPFQWGDAGTSLDIDEVLGFSLLWVETEHFKIGSELHEYVSEADKEEKHKLRGELIRLAKVLPNVPTRTRRLDPWLRLHLFAMRLEDLYAEVAERLGAAKHEDMGPYLGQQNKFLVLLFEKSSTCDRYNSHFLGKTFNEPARHYFHEAESLYFGTSQDFMGERDTDSALHCLVTFCVTSNLIDGFRDFTHYAPLWWREGLAHWFTRRIDPRWCVYTKAHRLREEFASNWEPMVRGRVEHEHFASTEEMLGWTSLEKIGLGEQLVMWSRVDYLLQRDDEGAATFQWMVKGPLPRVEGDGDGLEVLQRQALQEAWGLTPEELDRDWSAWVRKSYSKR